METTSQLHNKTQYRIELKN